MTLWHLSTELWRFDGAACLVAIAALAVYVARFGVRWNNQLLALGGALLTFLLAMLSPIAVLADGYLFSAHILQHVLLLLVVPPFLIASLPPGWVALVLRRRGGRALQNSVGRSPLSWCLGMGVMWFWHVPSLCSASIASRQVYALQCVTLVLAGTAFYWPLLNPLHAERMSPPASIAYLFSGCLACTLLGVLLTFAPISVCPIYMHPQDTLGLLPLLRTQWHITHAADQQWGGLLMWVPACLIYVARILAVLKGWLHEGVTNITAEGGTHGAR